jgi:hypothetical protein
LKQILKKINKRRIGEIMFGIGMATAPSLAMAQGFLRPNCPQGLRCTDQNINELIAYVINILLGVAFGIAVLFLIIGGFWYITSAGNEETAEKGKNTAVNAIIGIVIIILSYVIVNVVSRLVAGGNAGGTP